MSATKFRRAIRLGTRFFPTLMVAIALVVAWAAVAYPSPRTEFVSGQMDLSGSDRTSGSVVSLPIGQTQDTGCTVIRNAGTLPTRVRMYGTTDGTGLDRFISLVVTTGRFEGAPSPSCRGFVAAAQDRGMGPGVLYRGSLRDFPDDYAAGIQDSTQPWLPGDTHAYQVTVRLSEDNAAQGLTASQTFTWETRQLDSLPSSRS